jgi:hypothetical protein
MYYVYWKQVGAKQGCFRGHWVARGTPEAGLCVAASVGPDVLGGEGLFSRVGGEVYFDMQFVGVHETVDNACDLFGIARARELGDVARCGFQREHIDLFAALRHFQFSVQVAHQELDLPILHTDQRKFDQTEQTIELDLAERSQHGFTQGLAPVLFINGLPGVDPPPCARHKGQRCELGRNFGLIGEFEFGYAVTRGAGAPPEYRQHPHRRECK